MDEKRHIILFDGICTLCNRHVQTIIGKDRKGIFKFAALQSAVGNKLVKELNLPENNFKTLIYIKNDRYFLRSDAFLEVVKTLGGSWQVLYTFKIVPKFIRDGIYNIVAQNRYKWFGKEEKCLVPTPELKSRFL